MLFYEISIGLFLSLEAIASILLLYFLFSTSFLSCRKLFKNSMCLPIIKIYGTSSKHLGPSKFIVMIS